MQLDYQQFLSKVERLTDIQPVPGKEQVENYIKAYYMLETNLEQWIRSHRVSTSLTIKYRKNFMFCPILLIYFSGNHIIFLITMN